MTRGIAEDEQLFRGLTKITYEDERKDSFATHLLTTKEEVEAALATQPNGALFGSSYYTVPWSWRLWVYNKYAGKTSGFAKWMTKSFGRAPVLMSQVNPALRASVARSVLRNNGYFRGDVTYETIPLKNPKKAKIGYSVRLDSLFTLDSVAYTNFPAPLQQLIDSTRSETYIKAGDAFSVSALDGERNRISTLFRNNGYYFYNSSYASYLADTVMVADKAQLRFQLAEGLPADALSKWRIGDISVRLRKSAREQTNDSTRRRHLTIWFNGKKPPIRPRVILKDMKLRPGQFFSYDNYLESASKINATGVFSTTDFQFTPRTVDSLQSAVDSLQSAVDSLQLTVDSYDYQSSADLKGVQSNHNYQLSTVNSQLSTVRSALPLGSSKNYLDLQLNCVLDKPYDFYIEGNAIGRTNGRYGPESKIGFTRRNMFRGGEKLDINLHGSYEWQTGGNASGSTYQYGADASIEFPRILAPFYSSDRIRHDKKTGRLKPRRFYSTPTTYAKVSTDIVRRPEYYKMHVVTGEWTYRWQSSATSQHEFSPLTVKYQFKNSTTEKYDSIVDKYLYLERTMGDYFIPKMRYTYTYTSPTTLRNPIRWETTVEESGNVTSLIDMARGRSFTEKEKELFKTPYSQFLRIETDFTKTWSLGMESSLVGHVNAGVIWTYGNSYQAPYTEEFYVGGANSIRAFAVRDVGPGRFTKLGNMDKQVAYLLRNGDMKLVTNLEYRTPLFGNLKGAVFLDAGNVWRLRSVELGEESDWAGGVLIDDEGTVVSGEFLYYFMKGWMDGMTFKPSRFFSDIAVGTGVGLRYDLGFLVIRVDWGLALHVPGSFGVSRYFFNASRFKDLHTLNFAIGYPF